MFTVSISDGQKLRDRSPECSPGRPGFRDHLAREIQEEAETLQEAARIPLLGQLEARRHQQQEQQDQDARVELLAARHLR